MLGFSIFCRVRYGIHYWTGYRYFVGSISMTQIIEFNDLVGKTIASVQRMRHPDYDDSAWVRLTFTDGISCDLKGGYWGYSGNSEVEFSCCIEIRPPSTVLIPDTRHPD